MKKIFLRILILALFAPFAMQAQTIDNLYVSSTGFAIWESDGNNSQSIDNYLIKLNGVQVGSTLATNFQHEVSNLTEGEAYTTSVASVENGIVSEWISWNWVYDNCQHYEGFKEEPVGQWVGQDYKMTWTLPEGTDPGANFDPIWIHYDDGVNVENIGGEDINGQNATLYWGIMIPAEDLAGYEGGFMTKLALYTNHFTLGPYTANIYSGDAPAEENLVLSMGFLPNIIEQMTEVELSAPIALDVTKNLWVTLYQSGATSPASVCADSGDPNGRWVSADGVNWVDLATLGMDYSFMLRAYISPTSSVRSREVLFDQAQFVTDHGVMPDGSDASNLQEGQVSFGAFADRSQGEGEFYRVGDDFTLEGNSTIEEIEVFGYQVESGTTSTIDGIYMQIYQGNPNGAGVIVWGDNQTNLLTSTSFTNCYRTQYLSGTTRPIMSIVASNLNIELEAGSYWLVWGLTGTIDNGPWAQPIAISGQTNTGNAIQRAGDGWLNLYDSQCGDPYGLAMKISGINHGAPVQYYEGPVLGTMIYRDGQLRTFVDADNESFTDEGVGVGTYHVYDLRVVYGGEDSAAPELGTQLAMSCPVTLISDLTSVNTLNDNNIEVKIYPIPSDGEINIEAKNMTHISIMNALGQLVYNADTESDTAHLNFSDIERGLYMIRITTEDGIVVKQIIF